MSQPLIRIHLRGRGREVAAKSPEQAKIDMTAREAGQIIVVFALMLTALIGLVGIAIDVTFAWRSGLQIQRAADAGALAGVVYLPGDTTSAATEAKSVVASNGYTTANATVTAAPNTQDTHQLDVRVTSNVPTFFIRIFGINTWTISRMARAGFQLPVPMGSPEAFYGVYCLPTPSHPNCDGTNAIAGAASTTVTNHGAWGAIQATGTDHGQGDAFIPLNDRARSLGTNSAGGTNPDFDPKGYNYAVELPAGGDIYIYDPTACAVGDQLGTGDHWNDNGGYESGPKVYSVSTYYKLYNMTDSPLNYAAQEPPIYSSDAMFQNEYQYDQSGTYGTPGYVANLKPTSTDGVALKDCAAGKITDQTTGGFWHNKWWPIQTGLGPGTYRINITSAAITAANAKATFENDFAIEGVGGADASGNTPRVYGLGRIVTYNIIQAAGTQSFYLAQIGPENAGKTLEIDLFDIGDIGGVGTLTIRTPDGNAYNNAKFTYTSDANCGQTRGSTDACTRSTASASPITVANGGNSSFNDTWLRIQVKLPPTYGCSIPTPCLQPPGETQQGWWKIQYNTTQGANDTTTWMVSLIGNPVHLVPVL
jgi:hypothetical protein